MLALKCPYCGVNTKLETYDKGRGKALSTVVFCDNDECTIQPCTAEMSPQLAIADAKAWR